MAEQNANSVAITGGTISGVSGIGTVTSVAATAGTGISVTGSPITSSGTLNITNTAPDQVVSLTGAGTTSISGTYPNFTITSTGGSGGGDVIGPASSTDNALTRFDGTTGKLIQNSVVIVGDTGSITGVNALTAESLTVNNNATLGSSNTDTLDVNARITTDLEPNTDAAKDIGTSGRNWRDGFFSRNLQAEGKVVSPHFDALNSAGGQLRNASGTPQLQWGGGGGNNISFDVAANLNPANAQIDISPTGTGTVRINPATASSMNNVVIGGTTPLAGSFTNLSVTGTTSFDGSEGTAGQVLTSQGTGNTPTWTSVGGTGTVTSITAGTGLTGGTITTSGTIAIDSTVATLTGTQTLTNKTLTSPVLTTATTSGKFTFGGAIDETVFAVTGTTPALSPTNGTIQTWTLSGNSTPTQGTFTEGESMTLMINDGSAFTVTWTSVPITWVGGTAPTLATTGFTVIELWEVGTTVYGALVGNVA
jgi:hypothetical protein